MNPIIIGVIAGVAVILIVAIIIISKKAKKNGLGRQAKIEEMLKVKNTLFNYQQYMKPVEEKTENQVNETSVSQEEKAEDKKDDLTETTEEPVAETTKETTEEKVAEPVEEIKKEPVEESTEEIKEEKAEPKKVELKKEEKKEAKAEPVNFAFKNKERPKVIPFAEKMLALDEKILNYFDALDNKLKSFQKVSGRISVKGMSYRCNRELVAKITVRGKTMKLHVALDPMKFEQKVYFQEDLSDMKTYQDVPFTVKVKSDRGLKNALKLIDSLMELKEIEAKKRVIKVDSIAMLKESLDK